MNSYRMAMNIRRLAFLLKKEGIITEESKRNMEEAASNCSSSPINDWELFIPADNPIQFVKAQSEERVKPDIFCDIKASSDQNYPLSYLRLVLRIWSIQEKLSYRPEWDSKEILKKIKENFSHYRVISRFHYDTSTETQDAPFYHFQFHGTPKDNELYWYPYTVELPHFPYPPIDVILACEIVVATYFPRKYRELLQKGEWRNIIKESECFLLRKYYEKCNNYLEDNPRNKTLLDFQGEKPD